MTQPGGVTTVCKRPYENTDPYDPNDEYLTRPNPRRFVLRPLKHRDIYEDFYIKHRKADWFDDEVDMGKDLESFDTLNGDEQHFIKHVLAFFAASDGIVIENIGTRFLGEVQVPEARLFYCKQMDIEGVHSDQYARFIETLVRDPEEKEYLFNAIETIPSVQHKGNWALHWIDSQSSFAVRLLAFAAVEGIFFSGSFCSIYWLKKRGKMPGLTFSNELISRDEGLHRDFALYLYRHYIEHKLPVEMVHEMIKEAVEIEIGFCTESLPVDLIGMNSKLMVQYIKCVADHLLSTAGIPKIYHVENPFSWMDLISMEGKTNFFEHRVGDYKRGTKAAPTKETSSSAKNCMDDDDY
jgi:ribonucleoside-diphosphate reductase beta chain